MGERVLCVAAHPDDECIAAGATLAKHAHNGDAVMVIVMADGVTSRDSIPKQTLDRRRQCVKALGILSITQYAFGDWPDNRLDTVPILSLAKDIEQAIAQFKPSIVYTHHGADLNIDHQRVAEATLIACRPQPGSTVKRVLHMECASSTEWQPIWRRHFEPNYFSDIDGYLSIKLQAFGCYHEEVRDWPHPRSIEGIVSLAKWRGASVGLSSAEAFMCCRDIR